MGIHLVAKQVSSVQIGEYVLDLRTYSAASIHGMLLRRQCLAGGSR